MQSANGILMYLAEAFHSATSAEIFNQPQVTNERIDLLEPDIQCRG